MDMTDHQFPLFHVAQRLGQHLLRNVRQGSQQHTGSCPAAMAHVQRVKDHAQPFGAEQIQRAAWGAIFAPFFLWCAWFHDAAFMVGGHPGVSMSLFGAF